MMHLVEGMKSQLADMQEDNEQLKDTLRLVLALMRFQACRDNYSMKMEYDDSLRELRAVIAMVCPKRRGSYEAIVQDHIKQVLKD